MPPTCHLWISAFLALWRNLVLQQKLSKFTLGIIALQCEQWIHSYSITLAATEIKGNKPVVSCFM